MRIAFRERQCESSRVYAFSHIFETHPDSSCAPLPTPGAVDHDKCSPKRCGTKVALVRATLGAARAAALQKATMSLKPDADATLATANMLTPRERDVLRALVGCGSYEGVAGDLRMSINTVRTHVRSLYEKLDACTRMEAVLTAARRGLLELA
jgi:DNA-binding NarL/FixJ family response regulator